MKKICLEQKGHPSIRASLNRERAWSHAKLPWKRQRFTQFLTENMANRLNYKKFARLEGWPTLSSRPFVMVGSALYPGQRFSVGALRAFHWTKIPSEKPRAQWKVHSSCKDQTKATASLVIVLVSRIQIIGPRENNFVKWKETFRSDRLDQIRSVPVKGSHSQGETIRACAKAGWGQFFFSLGWEGDSPTRDWFSPYKGN